MKSKEEVFFYSEVNYPLVERERGHGSHTPPAVPHVLLWLNQSLLSSNMHC